MIAGKTVFITGGAGFLGSTLVGRLIDQNRVIVFDNLARNALRHRPFVDHPNLTQIRGDVLDGDGLARAMPGADLIVHCAAVAGIDTVIKSPVTTMRVNMIGSANVLEAAARLPRVERVLCFSSSEIFGAQAFRCRETDNAVVGSIGEARWTYGVSKLAEEHLAIAYQREQGLPATVLRPFNVYGPGQVGEGALRTFIERALVHQPITIHGDGAQIRAWCYVDDMVDAALLALSHPRAVGESFNIGNPQATATISSLAATVVRVLGSRSPIGFVPRSAPDVDVRIPSIEKAAQLIGFEPTVHLEEGIRRTAEFYRRLAA